MLKGETVSSGASDKDPHVSEYRVMRSAAGYYIGTVYTYCDRDDCDGCPSGLAGLEEPNSRETGYFRKREEAESELRRYLETGYLPNERF